jgi:hypothetical protein
MGEEVADGDLPLGGYELGGGAVLAGHQHLRRLELGQEARDRVREQEAALFVELQDRHAGDGLRLRSDAEEGVGSHRQATLAILVAHGRQLRELSVAGHEHDRPRQLTAVHAVLHGALHARQALAGQPDRLGRHGAQDGGRRGARRGRRRLGVEEQRAQAEGRRHAEDRAARVVSHRALSFLTEAANLIARGRH